MYKLIFFVFIIVCFILITLIMLNPANYNDLYNFSRYNNKFSILNFICRDSILNTITKIFIILFFIFSIIICILDV
ncbi:Protein-export membrane protein SecG [Buchnera aphidicola (Takecallis arundicolens)]|uniref:preprotein translocase subunit SecG n=1 Tax=Buchnera aphidicola TaxID=9 RepID=UPI003463F1B6